MAMWRNDGARGAELAVHASLARFHGIRGMAIALWQSLYLELEMSSC